MREMSSVKEKILDRAVYLIGKRGTMNVPVRAIAKEAGVNMGAINYYFVKKEVLIEDIKAFLIDNSHDALRQLNNTELDARTVLLNYANELMEYNLRYPGVTVVMQSANETLEVSEQSRKLVEVTKLIQQKLEALLGSLMNCSPMDDIRRKMIFISSIVYPVEKYEVIYTDKVNFHDRNERLAYINHLIDLLTN